MVKWNPRGSLRADLPVPAAVDDITLAGFLPEIDRVYATVGWNLFLWKHSRFVVHIGLFVSLHKIMDC